MGGFFSIDGPVITFLTKTGELILLTVVWLIFSLPVVTVVPALTSYYYAVVKAVRFETGYPLKEFIRCFKRTAVRGMGVTLVFALIFYLIGVSHSVLAGEGGWISYYGILIDDAAAVLLGIYLLYFAAAWSRFEVGFQRLIKMSGVMMVRRLPWSFLLGLGTAVLAWLCLFVLPVAAIVIIPGFWCYLVTCFMEGALHLYLPQPKEGEEMWYDGKGGSLLGYNREKTTARESDSEAEQ